MVVPSQIVAQLTNPKRRPIYETPWDVWTFAVLGSMAVGFLSGRSKRIHRWGPWNEVLIVIVIVLILTSVIGMEIFRLTFPFVAALLAWGLGETVSAQLGSEEEAPAGERRP
jgi:hypothetical protein